MPKKQRNDKETNQLELDQLLEIKTQTERFDFKANVLLAISGIILSISFNWIKLFKDVNTNNILRFWLLSLTISYIFFLCFAVILFILVITPGRKPKYLDDKKTKKTVLYYKDLKKMTIQEIDQKFKEKEINIGEQIKIHSKTTSKKHNFLLFGIISLSLSIVFIFVSILLYIF